MSDLEEYGIIPLTGEADPLCMRILCDLTEEGCKRVRDFFQLEPLRGTQWNSGTNGHPHVASVMIPRSCFADLLRFCQHVGPTRNVHQMSGRTE